MYFPGPRTSLINPKPFNLFISIYNRVYIPFKEEIFYVTQEIDPIFEILESGVETLYAH